jgi:hypothetical protein
MDHNEETYGRKDYGKDPRDQKPKEPIDKIGEVISLLKIAISNTDRGYYFAAQLGIQDAFKKLEIIKQERR